MSTTDNILEEVRQIAADVLGLDLDEVQPKDSFVTKLAGDSLGFLDLAFQCEKRYGVKVPFQKLIPEDRLVTDEDGVLTAESVALLKGEMPFLDFAPIADHPLKSRLLELFTIEAIAELVRRAVEAKARGGDDARTAGSGAALASGEGRCC